MTKPCPNTELEKEEKTLTSRERLIETLNHREPEKVVVDMGSTAITGINANALAKLRTARGLEERKIKARLQDWVILH